jgi:hypothetical protein
MPQILMIGSASIGKAKNPVEWVHRLVVWQ